jgi:DNA-directed RNA polymerase specialized sigma24 family protein
VRTTNAYVATRTRDNLVRTSNVAHDEAFWREMLDFSRGLAHAWTSGRGVGTHTFEDLAQECLLRLTGQAIADETRIRNPKAYVRRVLRGIIEKTAREQARERSHRYPTTLTDLDVNRIEDREREPDPVRLACLREMASVGPSLVERLPPPYREIARLQYLNGHTRRQIIAWLQCWRPVSEPTCRAALVRTHKMLRALGSGECLRQHWPRSFDSGRNRWCTIPPPPIAPLWRHREEPW